MKKKVSFIVTAVFGVMILIFVVAGLCVHAAEKNSFPPGNIYFARHNSFLSWTDDLYNPYFVLQLYEVKGGDRFIDYKDIMMRDSDGKQYELKDAGIQTIFSDIYFTSYRITCVLDRKDLKTEKTVFEHAVLVAQDGTESVFPIGYVSIYLGDSAEEQELQFSSGTGSAVALNSYNVQITNISSHTVQITGMEWNLERITISELGYYDHDNRYFQIGDGVELHSGDSIILHCKMEGDEEYRGKPFTELMPLLKYVSEGKVYEAATTTRATYFAQMTRGEIKDYLWRSYEGSSI